MCTSEYEDARVCVSVYGGCVLGPGSVVFVMTLESVASERFHDNMLPGQFVCDCSIVVMLVIVLTVCQLGQASGGHSQHAERTFRSSTGMQLVKIVRPVFFLCGVL